MDSLKLLTKKFTVSDIEIAKGNIKDISKDIGLSGYKAVSIGHMRIQNSFTGGQNSSFCNAYYQELDEDLGKAIFYIKNFNLDYDAKVDIIFTIIYQNIL